MRTHTPPPGPVLGHGPDPAGFRPRFARWDGLDGVEEGAVAGGDVDVGALAEFLDQGLVKDPDVIVQARPAGPLDRWVEILVGEHGLHGGPGVGTAKRADGVAEQGVQGEPDPIRRHRRGQDRPSHLPPVSLGGARRS